MIGGVYRHAFTMTPAVLLASVAGAAGCNALTGAADIVFEDAVVDATRAHGGSRSARALRYRR